MIELKKKFSKKGIQFTQKYKSNVVVVYQLSRYYPEYDYLSTWYEVLKYRTHTPDRFHDDDYEVYGSDEDCGLYLWSCSNPDVVNKVLKNHFEDEGKITSEERMEILRISCGV